VNISTIGVQIQPPGSGYYAASKAALEGLSGALYKELHDRAHEPNPAIPRRPPKPSSPP
jgi:short-subunit dehydrogenase